MSKVTILREKTSTRCDICHQTDLFDGLSNSCQRCKDVVAPLAIKNSPEKQGKSLQTKLLSNVVCYAMLSSAVVYLLWDSPQFNFFQGKVTNDIFEVVFKTIVILGIANCGFLCFSQDKGKNVQGWLQLAAFCFMAFAKGFIIRTVQWY
jgi:hypothetical protein